MAIKIFPKVCVRLLTIIIYPLPDTIINHFLFLIHDLFRYFIRSMSVAQLAASSLLTTAKSHVSQLIALESSQVIARVITAVLAIPTYKSGKSASLF